MEHQKTLFMAVALHAASGFLSDAAAQVIAPQAMEQTQPETPSNRFGEIEGWAVVRYSVLADGRTDNVTVVDKLPPGLQERRVAAALEDWRFSPATVGGSAVDWHNNESVIVLRSDTYASIPTPIFMQAYQETQEYIDAGRLTPALNSNERLQTRTIQLVEIAMAQMQYAMINLRRGDQHAALAAIRRATDTRIPSLTDQDLTLALQYRNVLEAQLGDYDDALATLERRRDLGVVPDDDPIAVNEAALRQAVSEGPIARKAKVFDEFWRHTLERRVFSIAEVDGSLDVIHVECDLRRTTLEYAPDSEYVLPAIWGECHVAVEGDKDTEFVFYEFHSN